MYTSGRYGGDHDFTTVAFPLTSGKNGAVVVYDLRVDPTPFIDMDSKELAKKLYASWEERRDPEFVALPTKELQYNRAPAVAPLGVLEKSDAWTRLGLDREAIVHHQKLLLGAPHFAENLRGLYETKPEYKKMPDPEAQLYDGFLSDRDKLRVETVRNATERELADFHPEFSDERLSPLLLHYKARNFPKSLSESEQATWEEWRAMRLQRQLPGFMKALSRLAASASESDQFMLQEMQLWAESVLPTED